MCFCNKRQNKNKKVLQEDNMKTFIKMLMTLGMLAVLNACGGSNNGNSDENQTTPETTTPTATQTCSITQGTPLTDTRLTVHVVCDNIQSGDIVNVTVDGNLKPAVITGTTVNDYLGFGNLSASTRYTAIVELNGQTLDTVSITTKATPVTPTPSPTPTPISTPTITMANQTVTDNGGGGGVLATDLPAPIVTGVNAGAVYSITTGTTGLSINSSTGVMTYDNDLFADTTFSITIKVTNTDGGNSSATFSLTVIDNL